MLSQQVDYYKYKVPVLMEKSGRWQKEIIHLGKPLNLRERKERKVMEFKNSPISNHGKLTEFEISILNIKSIKCILFNTLTDLVKCPTQ